MRTAHSTGEKSFPPSPEEEEASALSCRAVAKSIPDGAILAFDTGLRVRQAGGMALAEFGWTIEQLLGRPLVDFLLPHFPAGWEGEKSARAALAGGQETFEIASGEGHFKFVFTSVAGAEGAYGIVFIRNVTSLVRSREALREREQLLEELVGNFPGVVGIFDQELRFLLRGGKGRRFGPSGPEFAGPTLWQALPPLLAAQEEPHYRATLAGHSSSHDWEEDGHCYRVNLVPITHEGHPAGLFVGRDITAARRAEAELLRSRDEVQRLATELLRAQEIERSRIARELHDDFAQRIALFGIELSALQRLIATPAENPALIDSLTRLEKHVETLAEDIRHLSHRLHPALLEHVGLATAVRAHCEDLTLRTAFAVETSIEPGPLDLCLDAQLDLYRIAQEALHNARRHSGAGSASVRLERSADHIRLTVRDAGRGCDPTQLPAGSGLGLITMHERLRRHGGTCAFVSQPGEGATVIASIPLRP